MLPLTLDMSELNGNEKYHYLDESLPTSSCVVLFYETFSSSYSYTRLGKIDNPGGLAAALGSGNVSVVFEVQ